MIEEALKFSSRMSQLKVVSFDDCSILTPEEQKEETVSMKDDFIYFYERAAQAIRDNNMVSMFNNQKRDEIVWSAVAHIITGVIGAGVLSLAWSVAQLGWIAGPLCMLIFASITLLSTYLVCDLYRYPDPEYGHIRLNSYMDAVKLYLGEKSHKLCGVFAQESFCGCGIAYTITAASSIKAILKSNCYHREGHSASCDYGDTLSMLLFGLVQVVMSQIPDFHNMEWLSVVAAVMSFSYSLIGFPLRKIGDVDAAASIYLLSLEP